MMKRDYETHQPIVECLLSDNGKLPYRAHETDAGGDLYSAVNITLNPGDVELIDTGVAVKIPKGYMGQIFNRSSQGIRGITIPHSVGIIDATYRGQLKVLLRNDGNDPYEIKRGETRIAQLVISPIVLPKFVDIWNDTERGTGGFGSTGATA